MAKKKNTAGNDASARLMVDVLRVAGQSLLAPLNYLRSLSTKLVGWIRGTASVINRTVRLANILRQAKVAIADTYKLISEAHTRDLRDLAKATLEGARSVLAAAAGGADVFNIRMTSSRASAIAAAPIIFGSTVSQSWGQQSRDLQWRFSNTVQDGIFRDQSADTLTDRIEGTKESGFTDGLMPKKYNEARALTETAATAVANAVMSEALASTDGDVVEIVTWSATLDNRTCRRCSMLHGKSWVVKDGAPSGESITPAHGMTDAGKPAVFYPDWPGPPPIHYYCRCNLTPSFRKWEDLSKAERARIKTALGEALDGEEAAAALDALKESMATPADAQTFDEWLASMSHAEVEKILGPGRAKLWESGVSADAMVNPTTLQPLTIAQMQAKWSGERSRSNRDWLALVSSVAKKKK